MDDWEPSSTNSSLVLFTLHSKAVYILQIWTLTIVWKGYGSIVQILLWEYSQWWKVWTGGGLAHNPGGLQGWELGWVCAKISNFKMYLWCSNRLANEQPTKLTTSNMTSWLPLAELNRAAPGLKLRPTSVWDNRCVMISSWIQLLLL